MLKTLHVSPRTRTRTNVTTRTHFLLSRKMHCPPLKKVEMTSLQRATRYAAVARFQISHQVLATGVDPEQGRTREVDEAGGASGASPLHQVQHVRGTADVVVQWDAFADL